MCEEIIHWALIVVVISDLCLNPMGRVWTCRALSPRQGRCGGRGPVCCVLRGAVCWWCCVLCGTVWCCVVLCAVCCCVVLCAVCCVVLCGAVCWVLRGVVLCGVVLPTILSCHTSAPIAPIHHVTKYLYQSLSVTKYRRNTQFVPWKIQECRGSTHLKVLQQFQYVWHHLYLRQCSVDVLWMWKSVI